MPKRTCSVEGCARAYRCTGFCGLHYARWRKHGDPLKLVGHGRGPRNPTWKGDAVGMAGLHKWMHENFPLTGTCEICGETKRTLYASIGHVYTRNRADWKELCWRCHAHFDGPFKHTPAARQRMSENAYGRSREHRTEMGEKAHRRWRETMEWACA